MEAVGGGAEQNPSESSSIFERPPLNDRDKMNMMKGKGVERGSDSDLPRPPKAAGSHLLLDLKLSNEELNLLKPSKAGSCQASDIESPPWSEKKGMREKKKKKRAWEEEEASTTRVFSCNFCKREFPTSKAIAGHQNGHKQERALVKWRHGMMDNVGVGVGVVLWSEKKGIREKKKKKRAWEEEEAAETRVFSCKFCKREFPSSKAIAGHQNGHKQERALLKSLQGMMDNVGVEVGVGVGVGPFSFGNHLPVSPPFPNYSYSSASPAETNNATTDDVNKNLWPQLSCSESDPSYDSSGLDLNLKL